MGMDTTRTETTPTIGGGKRATMSDMTKGELRAARKAARAAGHPLAAELALDRDRGPVSFGESARGDRARERWARAYDALNGAPDGDGDR